MIYYTNLANLLYIRTVRQIVPNCSPNIELLFLLDTRKPVPTNNNEPRSGNVYTTMATCYKSLWFLFLLDTEGASTREGTRMKKQNGNRFFGFNLKAIL